MGARGAVDQSRAVRRSAGSAEHVRPSWGKGWQRLESLPLSFSPLGDLRHLPEPWHRGSIPCPCTWPVLGWHPPARMDTGVERNRVGWVGALAVRSPPPCTPLVCSTSSYCPNVPGGSKIYLSLLLFPGLKPLFFATLGKCFLFQLLSVLLYLLLCWL